MARNYMNEEQIYKANLKASKLGDCTLREISVGLCVCFPSFSHNTVTVCNYPSFYTVTHRVWFLVIYQKQFYELFRIFQKVKMTTILVGTNQSCSCMETWLNTQPMNGLSVFSKAKLYKPGICPKFWGFQTGHFMTWMLISKAKKNFTCVVNRKIASKISPPMYHVRPKLCPHEACSHARRNDWTWVSVSTMSVKSQEKGPNHLRFCIHINCNFYIPATPSIHLYLSLLGVGVLKMATASFSTESNGYVKPNPDALSCNHATCTSSTPNEFEFPANGTALHVPLPD